MLSNYELKEVGMAFPHNYRSCANSLVGMGHVYIPYGHQLDGNEIVNAPLFCYLVKWRNRKVAITGIVQLSNLISSNNGNKK